MNSASGFYGECLENFIAVARRFGYANAGSLGNEVLMKRAEQSVRELLKIKLIIQMFGNDPTMYYYQINGFAFAMGVTLAMLQANAPKKFTERGLVEMIANDPETSPHELAFHTMQQFGMDIGIYNQLVQEIYAKFQELHEPYWKAKEPRDYTLAAFHASFMTGASIALDKFAERRAQKQMAAIAPAPKPAEPAPAPAEKRKAAAPAKKVAAKKPVAKEAAGKKQAAKKKPSAKNPAANKSSSVKDSKSE